MKLLIFMTLAGIIMAQDISMSQPQAQFPTGNSSIEGTVINEVTQAPVRRADVALGAPNVPSAVTDAKGRFAFRNLASGTYWVRASHSQFPQPMQGLPPRPLNVTVGQDEHKRDLVIALTPGATISGTILDEDKKPMSGCGVQALQFQPRQPDRALSGATSAQTDSRGQYRLFGLAKGRYYLMAQCYKSLPAPHPLMRMGPDAELPQLRYNVEFYPSPPDPSGSGRLTVAAGSDLRNVDFQMHLAATVTVRGRFGGDLEALQYHLWVNLAPRDALLQYTLRYGGSVNSSRNTFRIDAVPPGQYMLTAFARDEGHAYESETPIDVGSQAPDPIEVTFFSGSNFTGSIEVAADQQQQQQQPRQPMENAQVRLVSVEAKSYRQWPNSKVAKDGTFALSKVLPGRWRLQVEGLAGYVKSFMIGDQAASPYNFTVSAGGTMRIVMGALTAQIDGTVTGIPQGAAGNLWLMVVPEDPDRIAVGRIWTVGIDPGNGHFTVEGVEPGKYRVYGFAGVEPWTIQQNLALLKTISNRGVEVDLEEGAQATTQVEVTPIEEISKVIQEQE